MYSCKNLANKKAKRQSNFKIKILDIKTLTYNDKIQIKLNLIFFFQFRLKG